MKKLTLTAVATLFCTGTVYAGPYIGANIGYTNANFKVSTPSVSATNSDGSLNGGLFGGYEFHFSGKFFLAGEVNINGYGIDASYRNNNLGSLHYEENYTYGLDILPGFFISQDAKLFLIGGVQAGSFKFKNEYAGYNFTKDRTLGAWDYGLGTDLILTDSFTLRLDYKYIDFNSTHITYGSWDEKIAPANNQFNLGIIYKFG